MTLESFFASWTAPLLSLCYLKTESDSKLLRFLYFVNRISSVSWWAWILHHGLLVHFSCQFKDESEDGVTNFNSFLINFESH